MKKILISIILMLAFTLSGCEFIFPSDAPADEGGSGTGNGSSSTIATEGHTDNDNDGKCDDCHETVLIELDFFVVNDMHGKITDSDGNVGAEELTTYLKNADKSNPNALFLSTGDMWQGSSESNLTNGHIMTDWMGELGFSAMTLGNHEFDWGTEKIVSNNEVAKFPLLAINVYERATNERAPYAAPSVIVRKSGLEIGIIGAVGDCYSSISSDKVEDVYFKVGDELTELVTRESERLRAMGCDLIVYSLHDGFESSRQSESEIPVSYLSSYYSPKLSREKVVDIVFEAHTHKTYILKDDCGIYHIQAGGENKNISHAEIFVNFANGKFKVTEREIISSYTYGKESPDPLISTLLSKYADKLDRANELLGTLKKKLSSEEVEALVAELYLAKGISAFASEYQIFLGGGYIKTRSPYDLSAGEIRYRDVQSLLPFDNEIMLCSISGWDLKRRFINSTNSDYFIALSEYGEAADIDDNGTYYIVTDSYTALYAPNKLTVVKTLDSTTFARDLLAAYIKENYGS